MDPRPSRLATILIDHSLKIKTGDRLVIIASDLTPIDLIRECQRQCLDRGAEVLIDVTHLWLYGARSDVGGLYETFLAHASDAMLESPPPLAKETVNWGTKFILLSSLHNKNFLARADVKKVSKAQRALSSIFDTLIAKDRVVTYFPTVGAAQNARMSLEAMIDYYYDAVLIDYAALGERIKKVQDILDHGNTVRIQASRTDLTIGISHRLAAGAQAGLRNIPDGECFIAPVEDQTHGEIFFEYPHLKDGNEMTGIYLRFEKGRVLEVSAEQGEKQLITALDDHPGNRCLGELGIGMNDKITQYMRDTLFDEKILGTIHVALGKAYPYERGGGSNKGTIHWDLVKDLRSPGTLLTVDDTPLIKDGLLQILQ